MSNIPENIKKACELAQNPGGCVYVEDDQPCCVIAQLATLHDIPLETLKELDELYIPGLSFNNLTTDRKLSDLSNFYSWENLINLQNFWDIDASLRSDANSAILKFAETLDWTEKNN